MQSSMADYLPTMKRNPGYMYPKTAFQVHEGRNMCKIRLELQEEAAGMYPPLSISMRYIIFVMIRK